VLVRWLSRFFVFRSTVTIRLYRKQTVLGIAYLGEAHRAVVNAQAIRGMTACSEPAEGRPQLAPASRAARRGWFWGENCVSTGGDLAKKAGLTPLTGITDAVTRHCELAAQTHGCMKSTKRNTREDTVSRCSASIVQRKYLADLRTEVADELSVRIEYQGQHAFFPLAENQHALAEGKAEIIRSAVARTGWTASARFEREFALAIFWLPNPLTCTYASLCTVVRPPAKTSPHSPPGVRVAVLAPDDPVRWGLIHWLNNLPGYQCVAAHDSVASFFKFLARSRPDLALFYAPPCAPADEPVSERLRAEFPGLVSFPFGIYPDSETAWLSVSGVSGGYYYRRRGLGQLLEPISGLWQAGNQPSRDSVESQIRNHVQTMFGFRATDEKAFPNLTRREREVLIGLQRGHGDKAIATMLAISTWTVHTHVKSLFEKLGVHSRTEAVMKYFQK